MALLLVAVVGRFSCLKTATYKRRRLYTTHQVSACRHMRAYTRYKHLPLHTCTSCGPQGSRSQGRPDFRTQGPLDEFFEAKATYHRTGAAGLSALRSDGIGPGSLLRTGRPCC